MKNKIVLITGATSGIGFQTALALAKMGAHVIVTGRSKASGAAAMAELKQASGNPQVDLLLADISTQVGVHSLAGQFKARFDHLDVLINNAGLAASKRELTADGIESNFAVNVVAPFMLTHLLLDALKASPAARIITLMGGDVPARLEMDNLQSELAFDGLNSYSQSKLAMMTVMYEFARRVDGTKVTINVCYPGQASTSMTRSVTPEMFPARMRFIFPIYKFVVRPDDGKSAAKAARSSVYLASSPELDGISGKYFNAKSRLIPWPPAPQDATTREKLWTIVEGLAHDR